MFRGMFQNIFRMVIP